MIYTPVVVSCQRVVHFSVEIHNFQLKFAIRSFTISLVHALNSQ